MCPIRLASTSSASRDGPLDDPRIIKNCPQQFLINKVLSIVFERVRSPSGHGLSEARERGRIPERARWASEESEKIDTQNRNPTLLSIFSLRKDC